MWAGIFFFLCFIAVVVVQLLSSVTLCDPRGQQHARFPYPSLSPSLFKLVSIESVSCSVMSDSLKAHWLYSPWDSPEKNTGVGCHFLLPNPQNLPTPGIEPTSPVSPAMQADSLPLSHQGSSPNSTLSILFIHQISIMCLLLGILP